MSEVLWHALTLASSALGMAWLALGMAVHWQQSCGALPAPARLRRLRAQGWLTLAASLGCALAADHPGMAMLVWPLALAAAAFIVAMLLAFRPHWLRPLG